MTKFWYGVSGGAGAMFLFFLILEPKLMYLLWLKFRIMLLAFGITEVEDIIRGW